MKSTSLCFLFAATLQVPSALSQVVLSNFLSRLTNPLIAASDFVEPIMDIPNIFMPPSKDDNGPSEGSDGVIISDVIGKERSINIFAGFTRDIDNISKRLDDSSQNTTVLAPLNSEIQKLPRKPWEDPKDYEAMGQQAYIGSDGEDRAHRNLRRFVEAHVIPTSPWKEGEKLDSIGGDKVWWENKDGTKMIQPGDIEVSSVANRVSNGEVWVLKGALNYQ